MGLCKLLLKHKLGVQSACAFMLTLAVSRGNAEVPPSLMSAPPTERFAPVALRGYGTVSGSFWKLPAGSVLEIDCDSADSARLTHAKYISDLQVIPGVKTEADGTLEADEQGVVRAYLDSKRVLVLTAPAKSALAELVQQIKPAGPTTPQMPVPMYLDRWDRFAFRHYYYPWSVPKGVKLGEYDYVGDFDWAEKQDHAGITIATLRETLDTADNMMNIGWVRFLVEEAASHHLPVDIHLGTLYGSDPLWFVNRYREQTQMKMPGFSGNFHVLMSPYLGGQGVLSWNATTAEDDALGAMQSAVRYYGAQPNVTSFLEPHNETHHGAQDIFMEYGPVADVAYRKYLTQKYQTIDAVAARWHRPLKAWDDVRVPEISSFAGDGPQAKSVGGLWHVKYEDLVDPNATLSHLDYPYDAAPKSEPAPDDWYKPQTDDSAWPLVPDGSEDTAMFLKKRPAIYRRTFDLPADWKTKNPRTWLYVWDLNIATREHVKLVLNGKVVGNDAIRGHEFHWQAVDVTDALKPGKNLLAVRVPQGFIEYKSYLSPIEPRRYPDLGEGLNAQWVDFSDFTQWSRNEAIRRGMAMIRQAAPHQGITIMHPDEYSDGLKELCVTYGGEFHNTGWMGAFYGDYNTTLMRGVDLPYSIEPSAPASSLQGFKHELGLYQTEGVQAIDYFIHIGSILWRPDIREEYETHRKQLSLMGQSHFPKAQVAVFYSDRILQLVDFPWQVRNPNSSLGAGYWKWNSGSLLRGEVPYDGLSQSSFGNGEADPYTVVIDSNTSMMDPQMVKEIEKWVRNGGTFVTLGQTGRSTPEVADSWPIASLTGYQVTKIDHLKDGGEVDEKGPLKHAADQNIFDATWDGVIANGLHMKKVAADARDLLYWQDGSVAAGVRPLGKGYIVDLGAKFTGTSIADRIEPGQENDDTHHLRHLLLDILKWRHISPEPGKLVQPNDFVMLRHGVTNNGLYDTWTLWNQHKTDSQTVSVAIADRSPTFAIDMLDETKVSLDGPVLKNVELKPMETRVFLTPIRTLDQAPRAWFDLQRKWWRGVGTPDMKQLPDPKPVLARDLTNDWKFKTIAAGADPMPYVASNMEDSHWAIRPMGTWDTKALGGGHAVFRRTFTVPTEWNNGPVSLCLASWNFTSFIDGGRIWLDGTEVKKMGGEPYVGENLPSLTNGTTHQMVVEVQSKGVLAGLRGECWIYYEPRPSQKLDLAGEWATSPDGLNAGPTINLPGHFDDTFFFRRKIFVDEKFRDKTAMFSIDGDRSLIAVMINGRMLRREKSANFERGSINVTPFLMYGKENDIQIVRYTGPGKGDVRSAFLGFYDKNPYLP